MGNFGAVRQIASFGGERLVAEVLAEVLAGRALVTVAMSEPGGGSALGKLRSRGRRDGDTVIVNGTKVFNSHGPQATHCVVWESGEAHCELSFDDCVVPAEYVLLDRDGLRRMMAVFNIERLGNATRSHACGELALRLATGYMLERETAGGHLADYQGLRWKLADMRLRLDSARLLIYRAALELRDGVPDQMNTSLAKLAANEAGFFAANEALQIFGGYGFSNESPLNYVFRRTRGWMIAGGTVEIQRERISREVLKRYSES